MKLFGLTNMKGNDRIVVDRKFGGYHTGAIIVMAEDISEAKRFARAEIDKLPWVVRRRAKGKDVDDFYEWVHLIEEIDTSTNGVIYYAEGEC